MYKIKKYFVIENLITFIKSYFIALFSIFISFISCKKHCYDKSNPECENFDPCFGKTKIKADFIVEENLNPYSKVLNEDIWIKGDTIKGKNINNVVRFTALSPADSFIWTIGAQKFYTKSVIQFGFTPGKHYPIQLIIINKNPNKRCFPHDNGRDTITRYIYTWPLTSNDSLGSPSLKMINPFPIRGYFKGIFKNTPGKEVIIRMFDSTAYCTNSSTNWVQSFYVENFPDGYSNGQRNLNCMQLASSVAVPFGSWGQCDVFNSNSKDTLIRVTFIARLLDNRKKINIKFESNHLWTDKKKNVDEFIGTKLY
jgi:hypothetical protein